MHLISHQGSHRRPGRLATGFVAALLMLAITTSFVATFSFTGKAYAAAQASTAVGCNVTYKVVAQWPGSFLATLDIKNTGSTTINGWMLQFTFPNGQIITSLFNGVYTQADGHVSITSRAYNATILPGASMIAPPGFVASWKGSNNPPTSFTLNGTVCSIG